jgi:hypothetical protein
MSKSSKQKETRWAVVTSSGKILKNAPTRESARAWRRETGRMSNTYIYDKIEGSYKR